MAGLQRDQVILLKLQLGGVFYHHDPLIIGQEAAQHVKQGGLPAAGPPADEDVFLAQDTDAQVFHRLARPCPKLDQVVRLEHDLGELAYRHADPSPAKRG